MKKSHHTNILAQSAGTAEYSSNECPGYDITQPDGETSIILELWEMRSASLLPLLLGSLWPEVVAPYRILSRGRVGLFVIETVYLW